MSNDIENLNDSQEKISLFEALHHKQLFVLGLLVAIFGIGTIGFIILLAVQFQR